MDILSTERIEEIRKDIQTIIQQDFWTLKCVPVKTFVSKKMNKAGTFNLEVKYIRLMEKDDWLES